MKDEKHGVEWQEIERENVVLLMKGLANQANNLDLVLQYSGSYPGVTFDPQEMFGDIQTHFVLLQQRRYYWHLACKAREAAKSPSMYKTAPPAKN